MQNPTGKDANRGYYDVVFYYNTNKELLEYDYAYWVKIWSDTGKLFYSPLVRPLDLVFKFSSLPL